MNDYKPTIEPTALPKIVVDRYKEPAPSRPNSTKPVLSNSTPMTFNANQAPSEGGFTNGLGKFFREQSAKAQAQNAQANSAQNRKRSSNSSKTIGWIIFALFIGLPFVGGLIGGIVTEVTDQINEISQPAEIDTGIEPTDRGPTIVSNECFDATLPPQDFLYESEIIPCRITFDGGSAFARESFSATISGQDPLYSNIEEYATFYGYDLIDTQEFGDNTLHIIDDGYLADTQTLYVAWVDDLDMRNSEGKKIETVSVILDSQNFDSDAAAELLSTLKLNI